MYDRYRDTSYHENDRGRFITQPYFKGPIVRSYLGRYIYIYICFFLFWDKSAQ